MMMARLKDWRLQVMWSLPQIRLLTRGLGEDSRLDSSNVHNQLVFYGTYNTKFSGGTDNQKRQMNKHSYFEQHGGNSEEGIVEPIQSPTNSYHHPDRNCPSIVKPAVRHLELLVIVQLVQIYGKQQVAIHPVGFESKLMSGLVDKFLHYFAINVHTVTKKSTFKLSKSSRINPITRSITQTLPSPRGSMLRAFLLVLAAVGVSSTPNIYVNVSSEDEFSTALKSGVNIMLMADIFLSTPFPVLGLTNVSIFGNRYEVSGQDAVNCFYIDNSTVEIVNLTISDCYWDGGGGAMYIYDSSVTMSGSTVKNCHAKSGGGIYVDGSSLLSISTSTVDHNYADVSLNF